jgi:ABC-type transport system involved in multi-copper enzyme maturation permease subunit
LANLKWLTPFKYFDSADLFQNGRLDGTSLLISAGIILLCLAAAYYTYNKRDLYI